MTTKNLDFLRPFVLDPAILDWNEAGDGSDLTKKVIEVLALMNEDPSQVTSKHLKEIVYDKDSQISDKDTRYKHFQNVARISRQLSEELSDVHPDLDLYTPRIAWSVGLFHDISSAYMKYGGKFTQTEKELPLFFHAGHLGVPIMAKAAMHHGYFGILKMLYDGTYFAKDPLYADWTAALHDQNNLYHYDSIMRLFSGFLKGNQDLGLIILTLADSLDDTIDQNSNGKIDIDKMIEPFKRRMNDIIYRNITARTDQGKAPTPSGVSLSEMGEITRIESYLTMIDDLLHGRNLHHYDQKVRPGLWKP